MKTPLLSFVRPLLSLRGALSLFFCLLVAFGLLGCASISVEPGTSHATLKMPTVVYVAGFGTNHGDFKVDRDKGELLEFKANLQEILQSALVNDLSRRLIHALPTNGKQPLPTENAWLIRGEFTKVYQGSRALRGVIGFGAGGTKLETTVKVYNLARNSETPFLVFSTTGGSNAEPGAITAIATDPLTVVVEAVVGGGSGVAHGLTEDSKRTAREITAELSDYMYHSGWISRDLWIQPKTQLDPTEHGTDSSTH